MKVYVHASYLVTETFPIEVDEESEIRDKAWSLAYDLTHKYDVEDIYDVDWEIIEEDE